MTKMNQNEEKPILSPVLTDLKNSKNKLDKAIAILRIMHHTNYEYDVTHVNAVISAQEDYK